MTVSKSHAVKSCRVVVGCQGCDRLPDHTNCDWLCNRRATVEKLNGEKSKKSSHEKKKSRFCPLQLTNQSRMDGGQDASGQSSSLLPLSGFPMQVRVSEHQMAVWFFYRVCLVGSKGDTRFTYTQSSRHSHSGVSSMEALYWSNGLSVPLVCVQPVSFH